MENKIHWRKAFNSDFLASCDVVDKDLILTIEKVKLEDVKSQQGTSKCNVAHFKENYKPMVLNVTNSKMVKKFAKSNFINDWNNIKVQIFVQDNVRMGKEITEGLRIRDFQPKIEIDCTAAIEKLNKCTSLEQLSTTYKGLTRSEQSNKSIIALKDALKNQLS
ncbi:MAG: hypothetical protein ACTSUK_00985 [Promethearchaeota archaeon]